MPQEVERETSTKNYEIEMFPGKRRDRKGVSTAFAETDLVNALLRYDKKSVVLCPRPCTEITIGRMEVGMGEMATVDREGAGGLSV